MLQTQFKMTKKIFVLVVLTCSYLVGEIAHFLTAVTSKHIANSIGSLTLPLD